MINVSIPWLLYGSFSNISFGFILKLCNNCRYSHCSRNGALSFPGWGGVLIDFNRCLFYDFAGSAKS